MFFKDYFNIRLIWIERNDYNNQRKVSPVPKRLTKRAKMDDKWRLLLY